MSLQEVPSSRPGSPPATLARRLSLRIIQPGELTWTRRRRGKVFGYVDERGKTIRSETVRARLRALAVPPAYEGVRYAADPQAHIQAVGRDAAGRLQYRYHPTWEKVREQQKAARMLELAAALPRLRRRIAQHLRTRQPTRELALAAVIELVVLTALRPGSTQYARAHGSRGAVTLLKQHVHVGRGSLRLDFPGKGGKRIVKECRSPSLLRAARMLAALPGRRFFQYRGEDGKVHPVRRAQVNDFLRALSGCEISLKDLRTLRASAAVMEMLASVEPAASATARRKQVLQAVRAAADELANTPAICRRSYVHRTVVTAFEGGRLKAFAARLKRARSPSCREGLLAQVIAAEARH
jgi:DNA topoisomerase-1